MSDELPAIAELLTLARELLQNELLPALRRITPLPGSG